METKLGDIEMLPVEQGSKVRTAKLKSVEVIGTNGIKFTIPEVVAVVEVYDKTKWFEFGIAAMKPKA